MAEERTTDWKDVASSYFDKCIAMIILFLMFFFIVFPNVETSAVRSVERIVESIEILPEILEKIEPPQEIARPIVNIEIVDDADDNDDDIEVITTIEITTLDPNTVIAPPPSHGQTPRFVVFEDAPVILRRVTAEYPEFARRSRIQGQVILEVEVLADGSIGAIEVFKSLMPGPDGFDESAIRAVRQWQFQPAKSGGNAVGCWIKIPITFVLE
jgi:protein TonB